MSDFATLNLGDKVPDDVADEIVKDLSQLSNVDEARQLERRAIDPASLVVIFKVVTGALGVIGTAWKLIKQIRDSLSKRNITGATITLPNGTRIEIDELSEEQLASIIEGSSN